MSEQERRARRERLEALREAGVDPFPARIGPTSRVAAVREAHDGKDEAALEADPVTVAVAGRVMAARSFGKLLFLRLRDDGVDLQVSARKGSIAPELFQRVKGFDVGDFVRVEGPLWRTRTGELTVDVREAVLAAKALRPLPEKWHGLQDVETRYRQRHLDLLVNELTRRTALIRSRAIRAMRAFLDARGFLEVETPVLQPLYGGAAARPFTTFHNAYGQNLYLRISDELYLKRLVVGGLDRVYEIGHNFRNEGISKKHSPEFTMMECYQAFADYHDMMELVEAMVRHVAEAATGSARVVWQEHELDLERPFPRVRLQDALREKTGIDVMAAADLDVLRKAVREAGLETDDPPTWGQLVDDLMSRYVEPDLIQPTFVLDFPVEISPLAKRTTEDPRLVERFELFVGGMEVANAFSELNDPDDQRARFEAQRRAAAEGDEEAHPMDEDYLRALEHGLPPTGGLGVGVDRLVMLLTDAAHLREVILFPHLRTEGG